MGKVVIIGGGAAGMAAAIGAAQSGHSVVLYEKNEKLGKKVYITGKGRCNVTNACDTEDLFRNMVTNGKFLYSAIYGFTNFDMMDLMEECGCHLKVERGNRVFPVSDKSSDVIFALERKLKSLGVEDLETPTGSYVVLEKKKDYASNLYGNIKDANGRTVKRNADITKDPVPEGGAFVGSPMPNWQRLTWDGMGMHTGKVRAGERLSHGCIRTPGSMAAELFNITATGTRVHVNEAVESCFPSLELLRFSEQYQAVLKNHTEAQNKLNKLRKQAQDEIAARKKARRSRKNAAS